MNCARNCENLLNFVKVMPKILLVPFFSGHGVYMAKQQEFRGKYFLLMNFKGTCFFSTVTTLGVRKPPRWGS